MTSVTDNLLVRNSFFSEISSGLGFSSDLAAEHDINSAVENCFFEGFGVGITVNRLQGVTINACTLLKPNIGVSTLSVTSGNYSNVYDCRLKSENTSIGQYLIEESGVNTINEDYNLFDGAGEKGVFEGADSIDSFLLAPGPTLFSGFRFPWDRMKVLATNDNVYLSSTSGQTKDLYGLPRTTGDKFTRGAIQATDIARDTSEYRTAPSSIKMSDASLHTIAIPINGGKKVSVTIYAKRETNYAGTNPQLVIRTPGGQVDTDTDVGSSGAWNKLSVSVTTLSTDRWAQIEFRSNNTAVSGDYIVWFDDINVKASTGTIPTLKWITNEIPLVAFSLKKVLDPWITPTTPVPGATLAPVRGEHLSPLPSFFNQ